MYQSSNQANIATLACIVKERLTELAFESGVTAKILDQDQHHFLFPIKQSNINWQVVVVILSSNISLENTYQSSNQADVATLACIVKQRPTESAFDSWVTGADLGGGSTWFIRAPFSSDLLASKNPWRRFPFLQNCLTDFFVSLKQLASDIQIVHTSKQIMSFVIIYLCTCTNNSNRSTWSWI